MRAFRRFPLPGLALLAACATAPREPTPEHPAPVVLPASETFVLHPRDGGEPYRIWVVSLRDRGHGPAWSLDGSTPFISVQHPGERFGTRLKAMSSPRGSNWTHRGIGVPPQPAVVGIRRR